MYYPPIINSYNVDTQQLGDDWIGYQAYKRDLKSLLYKGFLDLHDHICMGSVHLYYYDPLVLPPSSSLIFYIIYNKCD